MKLFDHLGVMYEPNTENVKTTCLWCHYDALSVDTEVPHQFQCFRCKESGNAFTYLRKYYETLPALRKQDALDLCSLKQGIKPVTIREAGVKHFNGVYYIPVYNQKGHLNALHKFVPSVNIVYGSPKPTSLSVLGLNNLSPSHDTVYVAEGHWDYFTAIPHMVDSGCDLLGTCGSYFSTNLLVVLKDKHIILLYDNDEAGKAGIEHVARHIKSNSISILSLSYLDWGKVTIPSGTIPESFDIRDLHNVFN